MTTSRVVKRRKVDEAFRAFLELRCSVPVGLLDPPTAARVDAPTEKYLVLTPVPGGESYGPPLSAPDEDVTLEYDVLAVGGDRRQTSWLADDVRRVVLGRDSGGGFLFTFEPDEHIVTERSAVGGTGAPTLIDGVYQAVESYGLTVTRIEDEGS